jgi:hypothetical protein
MKSSPCFGGAALLRARSKPTYPNARIISNGAMLPPPSQVAACVLLLLCGRSRNAADRKRTRSGDPCRRNANAAP